MIRIGILGCGRIGQVHASSTAVTPGAMIGGVADAFPEAAERMAMQYGCEAMSTEDIIASELIDAVVIGTPTDTHFEIIQAAAAQGKAIFCEKPVDMSVERIESCKQTVEAAGVPFMTGFNRRFDPNFASLQKQLRDGVIGDIEIVTILSRDPSPPPIGYIKSSGGIFRDMMIHDFDMARFLLGEEPIKVQATGASLVDPAIGEAGDVDTAAVMLTTASGRICQISNSRRATYGYDQRVEVHGAKGLLRADNQLESTLELATDAGFRRSPTQHFFLERYEEAYLRELQAFIDSVTNGTPPNPTIDDGLKAQRLADAATQAWSENRIVDLSS